MRRSNLRHRRLGSLGASLGLASLVGGCWGQTPDIQEPSCTVANVTVAPSTMNLVLAGATQTVTATAGVASAGTVTFSATAS